MPYADDTDDSIQLEPDDSKITEGSNLNCLLSVKYWMAEKKILFVLTKLFGNHGDYTDHIAQEIYC